MRRSVAVPQYLERHSNHFSVDGVGQDAVSYNGAASACVAHRWQNGEEKQGTRLTYLSERPFLSITLHSHIGHNKLPLPWLTGGPGKCILHQLKASVLDTLFKKNGQPSRSLNEKRVKYIPATKQRSRSEELGGLKRNISIAVFWKGKLGCGIDCSDLRYKNKTSR